MKRTSDSPKLDPLIEAIGRKREILGISQTQLAAQIGVARQTLGLIERGISSPSVSRVRDILEALDLDVEVVHKKVR